MSWRLLILSAVVAVAASDHLDFAESEDLIQTVNNAKTTWTAGRNFPVGTKRERVKRLLGLKKRKGESLLPIKEPQDGDKGIDIPDSFDARKQWPSCKSINQIRDQSDCESCWAVSAASAFSDRLCIVSGGKFNTLMSSIQVTSCCTSCGDGCGGGFPELAWAYFVKNGLVTGGEYGSNEGCQPYKLKPCEHHVKGSRIPCPDMHDPPTPKCERECTNPGYKIPFKKDHHKAKTLYRVGPDVKAIQTEILNNGPVVAGFNVFEDFMSYKSGVYHHVAGEGVGGHAVRVIGWGEENGIPYWLVTNSWNTDWGDNGLFKIKRGSDECGFESGISAGSVESK